MARFRTNLIANIGGAAWVACVQLVCVPLFIGLLGVEAYGLIGFFIALQMTLQILDLGLSATVNRELARYSTQPYKANEARDLLRTLEVGYWALGGAISLIIILLAPAISLYWLKANTLSPSTVQRAVQMMGLVIALQWPLSFYQGGMIGLQALVPLNLIRAFGATLCLGGGVIILWLISRSLEAFFLWQVFGSLVQVVLMVGALWRNMPSGSRRPRLDLELASHLLPFASGMSGLTLLGTILSQMDKVVLSRFLPLVEFGYYSVAGVVASSLQLFITPIFSAVFPRLSGMVVSKDTEGIRRLYHAGTQIMATCVLSTAAVLAAFAPQFIQLWTGTPEISERVAPIAVLLLVGTAINGLMHVPYALQLAYGWTGLGVKLAVYELVIFAPLLLWAAAHYGALGGALTWALLNTFYLIVGLTLTHRRLLKGEMRQWLVRDIGYPLLATLGVVLIAEHLVQGDATGLTLALQLCGVGLLAITTAGLAAPEVRAGLFKGRLRFGFSDV